MSTGVEHYQRAENCLAVAAEIEDLSPTGHANAMEMIAEAQVHATLALAAATALPAVERYYGHEATNDREWAAIV